ncbi:MAG: glycosyltransferase family 39 protein [Pseudomonadota bacterium]
MKLELSKTSVAWGLFLVLAATLFLAGLGGLPFIDRDEGEYAAVALEMVQRSDYVIPHANGRPYYEKPPLFFWLMVLSFETLGYNEAAGRLPSALSGLALALLVAWFGRRRGGDLLGLVAGLMTVSSLLVVMMSRIALLDSLLTLFTTMTLFFYLEGELAETGAPGRGGRWFLAAWASMGLAFLTKGPVGAAAPLAAVFLYSLFNRNLMAAIGRSRPLSGVLVFLVVSGPWYLAAFLREGENFWKGFFVSQNATRFTQVLLGHGAPLWFYLPVLAVMVWPWFLFALSPAWRALTGTAARRREGTASPLAALDAFLALWLIADLILFSAAATKQPNYILPAVPPALLLAARWWTPRLESPPEASSGKGAFLVTILIGLALAVFFLVVEQAAPLALEKARAGINPDSFEYAFTPETPVLGAWLKIIGLVVGGGGITALLLARKGRLKTSFSVLCCAALFMILGLAFDTVPRAMDYLQTPARTLARDSATMMAPGDSLASFGLYKPTLWFYTGRPILRILSREPEKLREYLGRKERAFVLSRATLLPLLEAEPRFRLLRTSGGYIWGDNGRRP